MSSNTVHGKVYSIQHYVIKFVSNLRQISGFFLSTSVSSTNKTDSHDITEILLKVALNTINQTKPQEQSLYSAINFCLFYFSFFYLLHLYFCSCLFLIFFNFWSLGIGIMWTDFALIFYTFFPDHFNCCRKYWKCWQIHHCKVFWEIQIFFLL